MIKLVLPSVIFPVLVGLSRAQYKKKKKKTYSGNQFLFSSHPQFFSIFVESLMQKFILKQVYSFCSNSMCHILSSS